MPFLETQIYFQKHNEVITNMLSAVNLSSTYANSSSVHENFSLQNLSFSLRAKSLTALIGPNGSGKTTLLRVLARLQKYSGSVLLNGQEITTIPRKKFARYVSFTMSAQNFHPHYPYTIREILQLHLQLQNMHVNHDAINYYADILGIRNLLSRSVLTLSDGQRQLALIVAALVQNSTIMLLDEPASALDPDKSAQVFSLLKGLAQQGKCIIASSHDINTAAAFADEYLALKDGVLLSQSGKLDAELLRELYGVEFSPFHDKEGFTTWHVSPKHYYSSRSSCPQPQAQASE